MAIFVLYLFVVVAFGASTNSAGTALLLAIFIPVAAYIGLWAPKPELPGKISGSVEHVLSDFAIACSPAVRNAVVPSGCDWAPGAAVPDAD